MTVRCDELVDRMPDVVAGRDRWGPEESAHLEACPECSGFWRMARAAPEIGTVAAAHVEPRRIVLGVIGRMAERRRARRWWAASGLGLLAAAAVIALLVWSGQPATPVAPALGGPLEVPMAELEGLTEEQLETVLQRMETPIGEGSTLEAPPMGDLDNDQLEQVLRSMEG